VSESVEPVLISGVQPVLEVCPPCQDGEHRGCYNKAWDGLNDLQKDEKRCGCLKCQEA